MKILKQQKTILLIGSFAILLGCQSTEHHQAEPSKVEVQQVKKIESNETFAYSGTIEESETIPLCFPVVGIVSRVYVSEGDAVKRGNLLASLNNATYKDLYEMALASKRQAEDAYSRVTPMYKNGNIPEIKYIEVQTGLQQATSSTAIAKKNLDDCNLYATTDGIIGKRSINPGMMAMTNLNSITIVKTKKVFARVSVSENEIALMKKGEKAIVTIGALGSKHYEGKIEEIGAVADPVVHTYSVKIGILNISGAIKPGMICTVEIHHQIDLQGFVVPSQAVLVDDTGKQFVYVLDDSHKQAVRKYVQTGKLLKDGVEITGGLNFNDLIVVAGQHKLAVRSFVTVAG
jgi:membrane fusion protein, multidrug efflux system